MHSAPDEVEDLLSVCEKMRRLLLPIITTTEGCPAHSWEATCAQVRSFPLRSHFSPPSRVGYGWGSVVGSAIREDGKQTTKERSEETRPGSRDEHFVCGSGFRSTCLEEREEQSRASS